MMTIVAWAGVAVCALVILSAICRINLMEAKLQRLAWRTLPDVRHSLVRLSWPAIYAAWATYALGIAIDLITDHWVDWYTAVGVGALSLYMLLTRKRWRNAAPPEASESDWAGLGQRK